MVSQGCKLIDDAKNNYIMKIGQTLSNADTGQKTYWSPKNKVLNIVKIPVMPPLLENDILVLDFRTKAHILNDYFILQSTTIDTGGEIPNIATSKSFFIHHKNLTQFFLIQLMYHP